VPVRADWVETVEDYGTRLLRALRRNWIDRRNRLRAQKLPSLQSVLAPAQQGLDRAALRLPSPERLFEPKQNALLRQSQALLSAMRFTKQRQQAEIVRHNEVLQRQGRTAQAALQRQIETQSRRLDRAGKLLEAYSYKGTLDRGFALVQDAEGQVLRSQAATTSGQAVNLVFADGNIGAVIDGTPSPSKSAPQKASPRKSAKRSSPKRDDKKQGQLF